MDNKHYDVSIIGAGQAGLALGYYLRDKKLSYVLLDKVKRVGDSWRNRYDSLVLFTPRAYDALPGMKLLGNQDECPTKDELADYLEQYAKQFHIPLSLETKVDKLEKRANEFVLHTTKGIITTKQVVIAIGAFQKPVVPKEAQNLSTDVFQMHTYDYRNPSQIPKGTTLIVGTGNSGAQIAVELAKERKVILSSGHKFILVPKRILGKSLYWWYGHLGLLQLALRISKNNPLGTFIKTRVEQQIIGTELKDKIKNCTIQLKPRATQFDKNHVTFADASTVTVDNIIWATGYKQDLHFIDIPNVFDTKGISLHKRGISAIPGLYFLGLYWLHTVGSAVLLGVGQDAKYIAGDIIKRTSKV